MVKEKKTKTISLRLTEDDNTLFRIACYQAGTTPSKFIRMMMDAAINAVKLEVEKGNINIEDYKAVFND